MLALLAAPAGCDSGSTTISATAVPTAIGVEPALFLGTTLCGDGDGSMRAYVATIIDVTSPTQPFAVRSTSPRPCGLPAEVRKGIVAGNRYRVEIDGYELDAAALTPSASGGREVVDGAGDVVLPRWGTSCGPAAGAAAITDVRVQPAPCAPLSDAGLPGPASVTLTPSATLGTLACSADGGAVETFDVSNDGSLPAVLDVACDAPPLVYDDVPLEPLTFLVATAGGDDGLAAVCAATPRAGRRVSATCSTLAASGALVLGPGCGAGVESYRARIGSLFSSGTVACADKVVFTPLAPSSYLATIELFGPNGQLIDTLTCAAEIVPGQTVPANCF